MKTLKKISAILIMLCVLVGTVPFASAAQSQAEEYRLPAQKLVSSNPVVFSEAYFALDNVVYDSNGDVYARFASSEYVYTIGKNCIITEDDTAMVLNVYDLTTLALVSTYDAYEAFIMPYEKDGLYTVLITYDQTGEMLLRHIMDGSGSVIVPSDGTGYLLSAGVGGNVIVSISADMTYAVIELMNGNSVGKTMAVQGISEIVCGKIAYTQNDKVGIITTAGETVVQPVYAAAQVLETGYSIGYMTYDETMGVIGDSDVIDPDGNVIYTSEAYVEYYDGNVLVENNLDTMIRTVKNVETGATIGSGEYFYAVAGLYLSTMGYGDLGTVYDKNGSAVIENVNYCEEDEVNGELLVWTDVDGTSARYSADGEHLYDYDEKYISVVGDGVVSVEYETDYGYMTALAEKNRCFTDSHEYFADDQSYSNCDVYSFKDYNDDYTEVNYTVYIVKKGASPFGDVEEDDWFFDSVIWAYNENFVNGVSDIAFAPDDKVTRAQIVTLLWRLEGCPAPQGQTGGGFTDVEAGTWYTDAIAWAAENAVVNGNGDGTFDPEGVVTRQQFATLMFRYAKEIDGKNTSARANLSGFVDAGEIEDWALEAIQWCVAEGHINGTSPETLSPTGEVTRAQLVTLVYRYSVPNWQELQ